MKVTDNQIGGGTSNSSDKYLQKVLDDSGFTKCFNESKKQMEKSIADFMITPSKDSEVH